MSTINFKYLRLRRPLAILDIEATGTDPFTDRAIEFAVLTATPDGRARSRIWRVNPGRPIPAAASAVHGIVDEDVAGCPRFAAVATELKQHLAGCDLAGFCVKRFDLPLLINELLRCRMTLPLGGRAVLDAYEIFTRQEPRTLSAASRYHCGEEHTNAHDAAADALTTARVLDAQVGRYEALPNEITALHQEFAGLDLMGCFRAEDGITKFTFGKYRGQCLAGVAQSDPDYLAWILRSAFLPDVKRLVSRALKEVLP